mgnify:CR=1 FL=1
MLQLFRREVEVKGYKKEYYKFLWENSYSWLVINVSLFQAPIIRSLKINSHQRLEMNWAEYYDYRSNRLLQTYLDAGQFY